MPRSIRPLTGFKPSLDGSEADSSQSWKFWQRLNVHRIISRLLGWSWTVIGSPTTTKNPAGSLEEWPNVWSVPTKNRPKMAGKNLETIETAIDWNRRSQNRGSKNKHQSINRQIDSILSIIQRWNGSTGSGRSGERSATVQQRQTPATFNQPIKMQIEMFQLKRIEIHLVVTATPSTTPPAPPPAPPPSAPPGGQSWNSATRRRWAQLQGDFLSPLKKRNRWFTIHFVTFTAAENGLLNLHTAFYFLHIDLLSHR